MPVVTPNRKLLTGHYVAQEMAQAIGRANIPRPSTSGNFTWTEDIKVYRFSPTPLEQICVRVDPNSEDLTTVIFQGHFQILCRGKSLKTVMPVVEKVLPLVDRNNMGGLTNVVGIFWFDQSEGDYRDENNRCIVPISVSCRAQRKPGAPTT